MLMLTVLLAACTPLVGVKVPAQVLPPSVLVRVLKVPLGAVTSALLKSLTASLKVMVTLALWPVVRLLMSAPCPSFRLSRAVGARVSSV